MPPTRSTSPASTTNGSTSTRPPSSPRDLPFLSDVQGNSIARSPITFETMSKDEAFAFFDSHGEAQMADMLQKIEAARVDHLKEKKSITERRRLNGAILGVTSDIARRYLVGPRKGSTKPLESSRYGDTSRATTARRSNNPRRKSGKQRDDFLSEVAVGESDMSLSLQASYHLESIFYELLTDEVRHHLRASLPAELFESSKMRTCLAPIFPEDQTSVLALKQVPVVPTTLSDARKCLGISKDTSCNDIWTRWKNLCSKREDSLPQAAGSIVLLAAHDCNGLGLESPVLHSVLTHEATRSIESVLRQAGLTESCIREVVTGFFRTSARAPYENEQEEANKFLTEEISDMKKKRKEDLAVIQELRKEVKELKSQAPSKPSPISQPCDDSSDGSSTATTTLSISSTTPPSVVDSQNQTEAQHSIIEKLTAQNRELNADLERERAETARILQRLTTM